METKKLKLQRDDGKKLEFESHSSQGPASYDPYDVCFEWYNMSGCEVTFINIHIDDIKKALSPQKIVVKDKEFCFLPHHYYKAVTQDERPAIGVANYGSQKFKGNKKPSKPM